MQWSFPQIDKVVSFYREQVVGLNKKLSQKGLVTYGVPRVSILGPLPFLYPATKKWRGILLYPPNRLSARPSVRQRFVSGL